MSYVAGTPFTVDTVPGQRVDYSITVTKPGRYVLEVDGASTLVGLRDDRKGQKLLRVCGSGVKGTHANTPAGQLVIEVDGREGGPCTINLRPYGMGDWWWSNWFYTRYTSTC